MLKEDPNDANAQALVNKYRTDVEAAIAAKTGSNIVPTSQLHQQKERLEREIEKTVNFVDFSQTKMATLRGKCVDALAENEERMERIEELNEEIRKQSLPVLIPSPASAPVLPAAPQLDVGSLSEI